MRFACAPVGHEFFDTAPWRFRASAEVPVSAAAAFAIFEDAPSWPKFFRGLRGVEWTSPKPFGVGTTRTVSLGMANVFEHFFRWEQGSRFSFYLLATQSPLPLFHSLAEDYLLEPLAENRCRFTYTVGIEPALPLRLTGPLGRASLRKMFESAPTSFARYAGRPAA